MSYAFRGTCDSHLRASGGDALARYSEIGDATVARFTVAAGAIDRDELDAEQLALWVDGCDPLTEERRGRLLSSPDADLVLDSILNAAKSFSIAALLHPDLATEYEALQDRLRDRVLVLWQSELNARRGAGGRVRESLARIEVVELQHRRSRALDPHVHRHLWLSVKVQGGDGKWSNVDSRVAMRMQTLVNAEGELAARTDPQWLRALAAHGYTLDADGEIAELKHVVRPLSRRSNQIEANRAVLLANWQEGHPGHHPDFDVRRQIDRYAWAQHRPDKPDVIDEQEWTTLILSELEHLDPRLLERRRPPRAPAPGVTIVDRDFLARCAVRDADERSRSSNGRFSVLDLRAGAARAVASAELVADRDALQSLLDDVTARALTYTRDLLPENPDRPQHVKALVTRAFAHRKTELAAHLLALAERPHSGPETSKVGVGEFAAGEWMLDGTQRAAADAIASGESLVTVTGPAGTGKTTLLRLARAVLAVQHRDLVVVAPTRKAAAVAGREVGVPSTSIHALLADYGWRWRTDDAGAEMWWQLRPGAVDPVTHVRYLGPRLLQVDGSTRIVVDEAGMLNLDAADALIQLALETGAGIAMIGDPLQASPVGHAGAMELAAHRAGRAVELAEVHRFADPDYATLTLRLRAPGTLEQALAVAADLQDGGHVRRAHDRLDARQVLVSGYFHHHGKSRSVAIVTGSNEEAREINEAIQDERLARGELTLERVGVGAGEQRLLEGDIVQTRRNERATGIENRALWTVARVGPSSIDLQRHDDATDRRTITSDYAAEYVQLAYATTVHGIQGETTDVALVGPDVTAAGRYVGLTRGRHLNEAVVIARTDSDARQRLAEEMMRGLPETEHDDAIHGAAHDLARAARDPADEERAATTQLASAVGAWLTTARNVLRRADALFANTNARGHARTRHPDARPLRDELSEEARGTLRSRIRAAEVAEAGAFERYIRTADSPPVADRGDRELMTAGVRAPEGRERGIT